MFTGTVVRILPINSILYLPQVNPFVVHFFKDVSSILAPKGFAIDPHAMKLDNSFVTLPTIRLESGYSL
jgi:hypothetical protein